jgi:hypothetical protein
MLPREVVVELEALNVVAMSHATHYRYDMSLLTTGSYLNIVTNERIVLEADRKQFFVKTEVKRERNTVVVLALEGQGYGNMAQVEESDVVVIAGSHHKGARVNLHDLFLEPSRLLLVHGQPECLKEVYNFAVEPEDQFRIYYLVVWLVVGTCEVVVPVTQIVLLFGVGNYFVQGGGVVEYGYLGLGVAGGPALGAVLGVYLAEIKVFHLGLHRADDI